MDHRAWRVVPVSLIVIFHGVGTLACAPIKSELGQRYFGAMRAGINCALANREILGHFSQRVFDHFFPDADLELLFDVSHNTCKLESHIVAAWPKQRHIRAMTSPRND